LPAQDELVIVAGLPPIRARKLRFHDDPTFQPCVPPTDVQGRVTDVNHPLSPPANLAVRPYPYGPPAPKAVWIVSHAKSVTPARSADTTGDGLEPNLAAVDLDVEASESAPDISSSEPSDAATKARPGVFGFDDHDHHKQADPDLGWNLPA
ncbi:MAG: hypothetical protein JSS86_22910, partial [Cyanobacteria bacterium SZAS LIN-2]|nr:hypothetical protein [Cyanobacteria bacterium SZAS LIN-2]